MSILLQKPGILTTVQDLGRYGYRRFGINPSGALDQTAVRLINILLGNDDTEAVLEMHFPAPQIVFEKAVIATIGGADLQPELDDEPVENWRPFFAGKNSILKFGRKVTGNRAYLAVKGGFKVDNWLGSSSTNLTAKIGGFQGRKLEAGDRIDLGQMPSPEKIETCSRISDSLLPHYSQFPTVRVIPGAEFDRLRDKGRDLLLTENFVISSNSNRMGYRLNGEPISLSEPYEVVSSAASFGTIQLLPDGQLIVLMADHQTAGGYPRIAHVITHDLPIMAQLGAGDKVAFHLVETDHAEELTVAFEKELNFLRIGCKFQSNLW